MKKTKKKNSFKNHLEALSTISQAITSDLYLEDILRLIVTVTAKVMGSKICSLMLLDEDKKELVVRATQSISEAYNKKPNIKLGDGIAGEVAVTGKPIISQDVRKDANYINREIAQKEGLCSLLSAPLTVKSRVIGVLNLYTSTPHRFSREEINILTTVSNQAAIVIENAQLLVQSKIIKEELETRKAIERAKGILMKENNLSEEEAFRKIQKYSMDSRKSMKEVAEAIILAHQMKSSGGQK